MKVLMKPFIYEMFESSGRMRAAIWSNVLASYQCAYIEIILL